MTVLIEEETEVIFPFDYKKLAEEIVETAIEAENFPYEAEVSLLLVSIETIQELNREYRKIDSATDVLSFPMVNYEFPGDFSKLEEQEDNFNPDTGEALLGDIVLCVDKVKEQATNFGHSEKREYAFLIMHSMLHLFGYDHMTKEEAVVMEEKQKKILNQMGILR
ncbi:MAG: rRNA maturation RNase YbeY [Lachnospiraceae bacterium]